MMRLRADPGHPAADPGVRADRLAGRAARLDRREVQGVDRLRPRTARGRRRPGPAAHQRQHLLVHRHRRLVGQPLLRDLHDPGTRAARAGHRADRAWRSPAQDVAIRRLAEREHTSCTGPNSTAAATSPPWRTPSCSSATSGRSSAVSTEIVGAPTPQRSGAMAFMPRGDAPTEVLSQRALNRALLARQLLLRRRARTRPRRSSTSSACRPRRPTRRIVGALDAPGRHSDPDELSLAAATRKAARGPHPSCARRPPGERPRLPALRPLMQPMLDADLRAARRSPRS